MAKYIKQEFKSIRGEGDASGIRAIGKGNNLIYVKRVKG